MNRSQKRQVFLTLTITCLAAVLLVGCNMPGRPAPTRVGLDPISTFAAQTVQAQLTEVSKPPATSNVPTLVPTATVSATLQFTAEPGTTPTSDAGTSNPACDQAKFIKDVSIPDNTEFAPGAHFVKTWRLENTGTCTWTPGYGLFFFQGDKMGAPDSIPLPKNVAPGEIVDVFVSMTAPDLSGAYKGEWKLRNASSQAFGIGESAKPVWVQILVVTDSGIDFISQASSATWRSGAPNQPITELTFGGAENDPNGVAKIVDGVRLETGRTSGKVLLTVPKHDNQGWISGTFQPYLIQRGNHLEARLGFMANPDGSCGAGQVIFQIKYREGESVTTLGEWQNACDGRLLPIDIDLSRLAGKTVQFILSVQANGSYVEDWAIWNSAQITK